jgi:Mg2+-importing ATPase
MSKGSTSRSGGKRPSAHHRWPRVLLGLALVGGLTIAAFHFSDLSKFAELLKKAQPGWLLLAVGIQLVTYPIQSEVWRAMARAGKKRLGMWTAIRLSLAKLFVDQSLPTGGMTGTITVSKSLEKEGIPEDIATATIVVYTISNQAVFVLSLALGLLVALVAGRVPKAILIGSAVGTGVGLLVMAGALVLSREHSGKFRRLAERIPPLRSMIKSLAEADPKLTRKVSLLVQTGTYQFVVLVLDAATLWVLLKAVGVTGSPAGVYASFVFSNVFHSIGIIPGGLGVFEAASVLSLRLSGVSLAAAISGTLMYRILTFWLPMIPSWIVARSVLKTASKKG